MRTLLWVVLLTVCWRFTVSFVCLARGKFPITVTRQKETVIHWVCKEAAWLVLIALVLWETRR